MPKRNLTILSCVVLAWAAVAAGDEYEQLLAYKAGQSRTALTTIEASTRGASPEQLAAIEAKLVAALEAPNATFDARQFVCRVLRQIGTDRSVPALAKRLTDPATSHMARFALQRMAGEKAPAALRDALGKTTGALRIGMIGSVGARKDAKAAGTLADLLTDKDPATVEAAIKALGHIATPEALGALYRADVPPALAGVKADSILCVADTMLTRGEPDEASRIHGPTALWVVDVDSNLRSAQAVLVQGERGEASRIYKKMMASDQPPRIRAAALRGLTCAGTGASRLSYIDLLKTKAPAILQMIGAMMADMPGPEATKAFAAALPSLPPEAQAGVLAGLATRGDKEALPAIQKAADSDEPSVQLAAIRAMGSLGDAGSIAPLAALAAREGEAGKTAVASLNRLAGPGVNEAMIKAAGEGKAPERVKLIGVLAARGDRAAAPAVTNWLKDSDASVRAAACKALGVLGGAEALPLLAERAAMADGAPERTAAAQALAIVAKGVQDESARTGPIVAALAKAPAAGRVELVGVLGRLGGAAALTAVREQLGGEAPVRKAAVRALADWPDAAALADVQGLARTETDEGNRTLALRGYIRQAAAAGQAAPATATMLEEAMKLARQPDEKKAVLAVLPKFACPEALKLAESAAADPTVAAEAKVAAEKIRKLDKPAPGK